MEKILEQHVQLDKEAGSEKDLSGTAYSYVYDEKYQKRHLERIGEKIKYLDDYLKTAKERKGVGGEEVKSNITDNESGKIKGAHGSGIQRDSGSGQCEPGDSSGGGVGERE
jgi:hypothetical protein